MMAFSGYSYNDSAPVSSPGATGGSTLTRSLFELCAELSGMPPRLLVLSSAATLSDILLLVELEQGQGAM